MRQLQERSQKIAARNHVIAQELVDLLGAFHGHRVPAIPLKGVTLALGAYGSLALRPINDIDLLVEERNHHKAAKLLIDRGYHYPLAANGLPNPSLSPHPNSTYLVRDDLSTIVDLHSSLMPPDLLCGLNLEGMWQHVGYVEYDHARLPSLQPADELLFLCAHASKHVWVELRGLCDIAVALRAYQDLDWDALAARAVGSGTIRMLRLGLLLAHNLLGAPVPSSLLRSVRGDRALNLAGAQVTTWLFNDHGWRSEAYTPWGTLIGDKDEVRPLAKTNNLERALFQLTLLARWRHRYRFATHTLAPVIRRLIPPTDADRSLIRLPRWLHFLYYVLRPPRIFVVYFLPWLWRRVWR